MTEIERVLMVAPRWMPADEIAAQVAAARSKHLTGRFWLLSIGADVQDGTELLLLPAARTNPGGALSLIWRLRRQRFGRAIVLIKPHRGEHGYLEAKLWTLSSGARACELQGIRPLRWCEELTDKWRRGVPLLIARSLLRLSPRTLRLMALIAPGLVRHPTRPWPSPALAVRWRLEGFVYLHAFERNWLDKTDLSTRVCLAPVEWDEVAQQLGWRLHPLSQKGEKADLALVTQPPTEGLACLLALLSEQMQLGGVAMVRLPIAPHEVLGEAGDLVRIGTQKAGWRVLAMDESLFDGTATDVWLRREESWA